MAGFNRYFVVNGTSGTALVPELNATLCKLISLALFLLGILAATAGGTNDTALKTEIKKLQGTWQVTKAFDRGEEPAPAEQIKGITLEFEGEHVTIRCTKVNPKGDKYKFKIDPLKKPQWIDFDSDFNLFEGIYQFKGDDLILCADGGGSVARPPVARPTEFKGSKRNNHSLVVLKKSIGKPLGK